MSPGCCEGPEFRTNGGYVLVETPVAATAPARETEIDAGLVAHVYAHLSKLVRVFEIARFLFLTAARAMNGQQGNGVYMLDSDGGLLHLVRSGHEQDLQQSQLLAVARFAGERFHYASLPPRSTTCTNRLFAGRDWLNAGQTLLRLALLVEIGSVPDVGIDGIKTLHISALLPHRPLPVPAQRAWPPERRERGSREEPSRETALP